MNRMNSNREMGRIRTAEGRKGNEAHIVGGISLAVVIKSVGGIFRIGLLIVYKIPVAVQGIKHAITGIIESNSQRIASHGRVASQYLPAHSEAHGLSFAGVLGQFPASPLARS